ncbi:Uncharacterised protein [Acinetobacter baumannii]|nr:Uncharacterised protein [Acinetobacter baumannii]
MVHGHADGDFVQADLERPVDADPVVGREQQEGALGYRVPGAGDDHRIGMGEQAASQGRAGGDQVDGILRAGGHDLQVVATGEDARLAGDDDHGLVLQGLVESLVEGVDHRRGDGVHLAVVEGQGGDAVFELVADQLAHGRIPFGGVAQTLLMGVVGVKRFG